MNFILRYRIRVHNLRNRKRRYEARNFELSSSKFRILLLFTILSTHPYVVSIPLIRILEPDFICWIIELFYILRYSYRNFILLF